jgi:uncharacterized membrane protein YagU involved in acid resistance
VKYQAATVAGIAGSFAMDLVQDSWSAIFSRNRVGDERDEETEAIVAVVKRIAKYVPGDYANKHPGTVGRIIHYIFGSAFGLAYAAMRTQDRRVAAGGGTAFGAALWLLSDVVLIPTARLGRPFWRYSRADRWNAVLSHLAYAATLEAFLRLEEARAKR